MTDEEDPPKFEVMIRDLEKSIKEDEKEFYGEKTVEEALRIGEKDIESVLGGLPEDNEHTPELAVNTLKAALEDYIKKH